MKNRVKVEGERGRKEKRRDGRRNEGRKKRGEMEGGRRGRKEVKG